MCVDESSVKSKTKGDKFWLTYISNIINKFLDILTNELPKHVLLFCNVDHKFEVVPRLVPPFKSPYMFNIKKIQKLMAQIKDLMDQRYIRLNKLPYGSPISFVDKKGWEITQLHRLPRLEQNHH